MRMLGGANPPLGGRMIDAVLSMRKKDKKKVEVEWKDEDG